MNRFLLALCATLLLSAVAATGLADEGAHPAHPAHGNETRHQDHENHPADEAAGHHDDRIALSGEMAKTLGITTAVAGPGKIEKHLLVHGRLVIPPDRQVRVRARFPGVVEAVQVDLGEPVKKGQVLARIESDRSLSVYALRAPMSGRVLARSVAVGEVTGNRSLFRIADTSVLQARLRIFPGQRDQVAVGQTVHLDVQTPGDPGDPGEYRHAAVIEQLLPSAGSAPHVIALISLPDPDHRLVPGEWVAARIDVALADVAVRVDNRALQRIKGETVVFVAVAGGYEKRAVETGLQDGRFTQVLAGLRAGERYVVTNSYVLKADLLKAGATHSH